MNVYFLQISDILLSDKVMRSHYYYFLIIKYLFVLTRSQFLYSIIQRFVLIFITNTQVNTFYFLFGREIIADMFFLVFTIPISNQFNQFPS